MNTSPLLRVTLACLEFADADFRSLQVAHDADSALQARATPRAPVPRARGVLPRCRGRNSCAPRRRRAAIMRVSTSRSLDAGPRVATIFVLRCMAQWPALLLAARCFEDFHGRKFLAFQEFQESAAAGGNVADFVFDPVFRDRRNRIAATGDRECRRSGDRMRDASSCPRRNGRTRTHRPGRSRRWCRPCASASASLLAVFGPISRIRSSAATSPASFTVALARCGEFLGAHHVDRDRHDPALRLRSLSMIVPAPRRPDRPRPATCRSAGPRQA